MLKVTVVAFDRFFPEMVIVYPAQVSVTVILPTLFAAAGSAPTTTSTITSAQYVQCRFITSSQIVRRLSVVFSQTHPSAVHRPRGERNLLHTFLEVPHCKSCRWGKDAEQLNTCPKQPSSAHDATIP